jgi:hypothetical protein
VPVASTRPTLVMDRWCDYKAHASTTWPPPFTWLLFTRPRAYSGRPLSQYGATAVRIAGPEGAKPTAFSSLQSVGKVTHVLHREEVALRQRYRTLDARWLKGLGQQRFTR